jgi:FkbM family methyltransferase
MSKSGQILAAMFNVVRRNLYFDNWPIILWQRAFCRKARLLAFRRGTMEFVVDYAGDDQCGILPCLTSDMYSRYFGLFQRERPLRVLDLGANAGGFCLALLAAGFNFEKVVCVEMNRRTWARLQFNIGQNFECETVLLNVAVTGQEGVIHVRDSRGGTSESIYAKTDVSGRMVAIPAVTFDGLMHKHFCSGPDTVIDVCKMDIEGAEYEVLQSPACKTIRRVNYLIIEIHPHPALTEVELIRKIESFGFKRVADAAPSEQNVHLFRNTAL